MFNNANQMFLQQLCVYLILNIERVINYKGKNLVPFPKIQSNVKNQRSVSRKTEDISKFCLVNCKK